VTGVDCPRAVTDDGRVMAGVAERANRAIAAKIQSRIMKKKNFRTARFYIAG
jgi:hypothetical protein